VKSTTEVTFLDARVVVLTGDITERRVDALVNAANSSLLGGGGVDGAIHRRGGPAIVEACRELRLTAFPGGLPAGEVVITTGGNLAARYVIHTVGPIWGHDRDAERLLAACYRKSIEIAAANQLASVAFPAISTGIYGYPKPAAAEVASVAISGALRSTVMVERVELVFFTPADAATFLEHQRFGEKSPRR
jgi:O-acetyl-ADP-ribose deacetylase (regulator of RNase III)